jgi:hypothetical protein
MPANLLTVMKASTNKHRVYQLILALLVLLMVYAAANKGLAFGRFNTQLSRSPILSAWHKPAAIAILLAELLAVSLLFFRRTQRLGLWACLVLLCVFTVYIIGMLLFSPKLPCSCGGIIEKLGWKGHIVFNSFFIVLAAYGLHLNRTGSSP